METNHLLYPRIEQQVIGWRATAAILQCIVDTKWTASVAKHSHRTKFRSVLCRSKILSYPNGGSEIKPKHDEMTFDLLEMGH